MVRESTRRYEAKVLAKKLAIEQVMRDALKEEKLKIQQQLDLEVKLKADKIDQEKSKKESERKLKAKAKKVSKAKTVKVTKEAVEQEKVTEVIDEESLDSVVSDDESESPDNRKRKKKATLAKPKVYHDTKEEIENRLKRAMVQAELRKERIEKQKELRADIERKYAREGPDLEFIDFQKRIAIEQAYRRATVQKEHVYVFYRFLATNHIG